MALDEVEAVEAEPFGDRGACGEGEHEAHAHQQDEGGEKKSVDRPEPVGHGATFGSAYHQSVPFPGA